MSRRLLDVSDAREPPNRVKPGIGFFVPEAPIPSRPLYLGSVTPVSRPKLPCSSPCLQGVGPGRQLARRKLRPRLNGSSSSNSTSSLHERLQPNLTSRLEAVA